MNLKNTENIFILGIFLALTGLISALLLAFVSGIAAGPIHKAELANTNRALKDVLPEFDNQPSELIAKAQSPDGTEVIFMGARKDGKLIAVAAEATNKLGYAGGITALVGLDLDGKIRAVLITKQNETPGLGTKVCERKASKTIFTLFEPAKPGLAPNPILDQFDGKIADAKVNWKVKKDGGTIEYVTGATVTSRAVTLLVSEIDRCYLLNRAKIHSALKDGGKK